MNVIGFVSSLIQQRVQGSAQTIRRNAASPFPLNPEAGGLHATKLRNFPPFQLLGVEVRFISQASTEARCRGFGEHDPAPLPGSVFEAVQKHGLTHTTRTRDHCDALMRSRTVVQRI